MLASCSDLVMSCERQWMGWCGIEEAECLQLSRAIPITAPQGVQQTYHRQAAHYLSLSCNVNTRLTASEY
jgi:hypothetical protein